MGHGFKDVLYVEMERNCYRVPWQQFLLISWNEVPSLKLSSPSENGFMEPKYYTEVIGHLRI